MTMTGERLTATSVALSPYEAREALSAEWRASAPTTPGEISVFYRTSEHLGDDLAAFHTNPTRRRWTEIVTHIAKTQEIASVVDIGCGAGHDLIALHDTVPGLNLYGVEPNNTLRERLAAGFRAHCEARTWGLTSDVAFSPIETADLLVCIDVLEHVPDPEAYLTGLAQRAKIGAWFIEATATHDHGTPLHLRENWAWNPGHAFEVAGWERVSQEGRLHIWRRVRAAVEPRATLMLCAYRSCSLPTMRSIITTLEMYPDQGWRVYMGGEAGVHRTRNVAASRWYRETADDVFVMVDDDITFTPQQLERLVEQCRNGHDIICAAYPVRDGGHLALRGKHGELTFGEGLEPVEIEYASTGFLAVHRRVLDALVPTLPLCHANQPFAFWTFFDYLTVPDESAGGFNHLSEDWNFSRKAQDVGFTTWLDPSIFLGHLGTVEINVRNMANVHKAITG